MPTIPETRNSVAYLWLGNLDTTKRDHRAAIANYRKAVDIDPNSASALNNLASTLSEYSNARDESLKFARQAREQAPDQPEYADTLGWILYRKGVYNSAVKVLEGAVAEKEAEAGWKCHLAMAYLKGGSLRRARAKLDAELKQNPNAAEAQAARKLFGITN